MDLLRKLKRRGGPAAIGILLFLAGVGSLSSRMMSREAAITGEFPKNVVVDERSNGTAGPTKASGTDLAPQVAGVSQPLNSHGGNAGKLLDDQPEVERIVEAAATLPPLKDRIVKTGSVTLKVKKGRFGPVFDQVVMVTAANGGYVAGSNSAATAGTPVSGALTIKVPTKSFEAVVGQLRRFGKVTAMNVNSQDVSTEFVDLESRLRHWRSQETILLGLMAKAQTIGDSVMIQQQLSQLQLEIEQITGRLNFLKDQTDFSSLQVQITEGGVVAFGRDPWGFKTAVNQAAHGFVDTVNGLVLLAGYLSPLVILSGLAGLIWIGVRRRYSGGAPVGA